MAGENKVKPFETALSETGFGLYSYMLTAFSGLAVISCICITYGSTIIVPASACELGTTPAQQGLIVAAPVIGLIIGAILWGYLGDSRGRRSMLLTSLLSSAAVNAISSISVHWSMLMVLQFIASLMASGQYSLSMTLLSESVPQRRRDMVLLFVTSICLLSQGIMSLLAMPIIPLTFSYHLPALGIYWNSWRTFILVLCLPSILAASWLCFMLESPKYLFAKGDEEGALDALRAIHRINNRTLEELQIKGLLVEAAESSEAPASVKDRILPLFKAPLLKYFIIMTTLSVFLQIASFLVWLPKIANQFVEIVRTGEGSNLTLCGIIAASSNAKPDPNAAPCSLNQTALLIVFCISALQSLLNAAVTLVVDRIGRRTTVMVVTATCGACGIVVNMVPNAFASAALFVVFLAGMLSIGLYTAISVALFPTHLRALAISLTMTGGRITNFAVIQILNFLLLNNCEVGFYLLSSVLAASAIVASFLPNDRSLLKSVAESQMPLETR